MGGEATSSRAGSSSESCSYVPECYTQGSGGSSGGGNRNTGGNFGGNRNNGGNNGGNRNGGNSGGNCQVDCQQGSCTVSDGRGTLGSCFLPPFQAKCAGLPSGCGSCVNQCSKK